MNQISIARNAKRKVYLNIVLPLFLSSMIAYIDRVNISYAALTMNFDLKFDPAVYGLGAAIFFVGYFIFEIPGALIAERYSPRFWLARIMITWGLISGLMAFMSKPWHFYTLRFALGLAEASLYPVIYGIFIPRWFAARERAVALAFLLTSLQISGVVGAPLAGWLTEVPLFGLKGWQVLFVVEAIPAIILGITVVFWIADWPRDAKWLTAEERKYLTDQYERELALKTAHKHYSLVEALKNREVLRLCLIYFLWVTGFWGFNYWMPTVLKGVSGWSNAFVGQTFAVAMAISLVAMIYIGYSSAKRYERRWHVAVCLWIGAFGMGAAAYATNAWAFLIFMTLAAVGIYGPVSVWWSYPTTFLSGAAAAGASGMINSCGNLGGFVGPYITGWIKQTTGSFTGAMVYLAISITMAGLLILTLRKQLPTDNSNEVVTKENLGNALEA